MGTFCSLAYHISYVMVFIPTSHNLHTITDMK
jgi:hypothetical protein